MKRTRYHSQIVSSQASAIGARHEMTLRQEEDQSNDIAFDSDPAWEAYGSKKKKDRESHRLGSTKKESRQPHRLGSAKDGFGEVSNSSFALHDRCELGNEWKSFTEDRGWHEMDKQQAQAWKTAQRERNMARGDGRRGSTSRRNSSSSSLEIDDIQEELQTPLKVNPSIGIRRVDRSASMRMVSKAKVNGLKHSTSETDFSGSEQQTMGVSPPLTNSRGISPLTEQRSVRQSKSGDLQHLQLDGASDPTRTRTRRNIAIYANLSLDNTVEGSETGGRRVPQRTKSLDVDMLATIDNDLGFGTTSLDKNPNDARSFRLAAGHEAPSGRSRRRASLAVHPPPPPQVQHHATSEPIRARSRRRASLAVGAASPSVVQDLQSNAVPNDEAHARSRRRASLVSPDAVDGLQNLQLVTSNETPRVRTRRRASIAANDVNIGRQRGVHRAKSMDVDMLGSGNNRLALGSIQGSSSASGGAHSFRNVRRIQSIDSQDTSFRNASRLGIQSASGITDETDIPPPPPQQSRSPLTRSPRMVKDANPSSNLTHSADPQRIDDAGPGRHRKNKLSPRSRRRLNMRRINSIDSACSSNDRDVKKAPSKDAKISASPTTSRQNGQGRRRQGPQRANSSGLQDLISGLQSTKKSDLGARFDGGEDMSTDTGAQKRLQTHLEDKKLVRAGGSADSVSNDSSTVTNSVSTNSDLEKNFARPRTPRLEKHLWASRTGNEELSGEAGSVASGSLSHSSSERRGVVIRSGSGRLKEHGANSSSNTLKMGDSESSIKSEQSRSMSSRLSRQYTNDNFAPESTTGREEERTPTSRAARKRRGTPKRGVDRSKSIDDSMTFGAWTPGDSSVRSRKKLSKSPSRRKSVAAGECQPHSIPNVKKRVKNGDDTAHSELAPHDKGFIKSFLGSPEPC